MAHSNRVRLSVLVLAAACGGKAATSPAPPARDPLEAAGAAITADVLRGHVAKLSSDELEGRGPTTRGDRAARAYLVEQLKAMGYEPGGAGGAWEQPFDVVGMTAS